MTRSGGIGKNDCLTFKIHLIVLQSLLHCQYFLKCKIRKPDSDRCVCVCGGGPNLSQAWRGEILYTPLVFQSLLHRQYFLKCKLRPPPFHKEKNSPKLKNCHIFNVIKVLRYLNIGVLQFQEENKKYFLINFTPAFRKKLALIILVQRSHSIITYIGCSSSITIIITPISW